MIESLSKLTQPATRYSEQNTKPINMQQAA